MHATQNGSKKLTVLQAMKVAQQRGKDHPDYDARVYYGDLLWTRVIPRAPVGVSVFETYEIGPDIQSDRQKVKSKVRGKKNLGKELFNPDTFKADHSPLKVADHKLSESKLLHYAKLVTKLRADI
jgi:hypothetical protein